MKIIEILAGIGGTADAEQFRMDLPDLLPRTHRFAVDSFAFYGRLPKTPEAQVPGVQCLKLHGRERELSSARIANDPKLLSEAKQLCAIFTASLKTARRNASEKEEREKEEKKKKKRKDDFGK